MVLGIYKMEERNRVRKKQWNVSRICVPKAPFRFFDKLKCQIRNKVSIFVSKLKLRIKHKTKWFFHFENNCTVKFRFEVGFSFFILI